MCYSIINQYYFYYIIIFIIIFKYEKYLFVIVYKYSYSQIIFKYNLCIFFNYFIIFKWFSSYKYTIHEVFMRNSVQNSHDGDFLWKGEFTYKHKNQSSNE